MKEQGSLRMEKIDTDCRQNLEKFRPNFSRCVNWDRAQKKKFAWQNWSTRAESCSRTLCDVGNNGVNNDDSLDTAAHTVARWAPIISSVNAEIA